MMYTVELDDGTVGLLRATNIQQAHRRAVEQEGRAHVTRVKHATPNEIAWIQQMGGRVPEEGDE